MKENMNREFKLLKKNFRKSLVSIILIVVITLSVGSFTTYGMFLPELQDKIANAYEQKTGWLYSDGTLNGDMAETMKTFMKDLPENIRQSIETDWTFLCSEKMPDYLQKLANGDVHLHDDAYSDYICGGYTFAQYKVVYICTTLDSYYIYQAFVHEIGHVASFLHYQAHGTFEWNDIYLENKALFDTNEYSVSNSAEFFASCFEEYYNHTEHLKDNSIDAYNYIDNLLQEEVKNSNIVETYFSGMTALTNVINSRISGNVQ